MRRYSEASEHNPQRPKLRKGGRGQYKLHTCSRCAAAAQGIPEHEVVTLAARQNKGAGSIAHAAKR
eukprot:4775760-Pyramimonas_sp.AAC.1